MATLVRPSKAPIVLDQVVEDPDAIRQMARGNGPYWQPGRTIASSKAAVDVADNDGDDDDTDFTNAMVGPTFRGQWAFGEPQVDGAEALLANVFTEVVKVSEQLGMSQYALQDVIEIMCDTASQNTEALSALGIDELPLELIALVGIADRPNKMISAFCIIKNG